MAYGHGRLVLLTLALVCMLAACAPTAALPTATAAPTPATAITPDAAQPLVLVLPSLYNNQNTLIAANRHYSDAVKRKGWNVEFYTVQSNDAEGTDTYLPYVSKQLCSGAARADGFVCMQYLPEGSADLLTQAKNSGQLYDCVAAAPQVVPQYWAKYQDQISTGEYGLVLATHQTPSLISDLAFAVRKDVLPMVDKELWDYDDLRVLIAKMEQAHTQNPTAMVIPQHLLSLWTKQQGYLELFAEVGIYARMDDPDAKPVLLEDIPAFSQFFEDILALQARGFFVPEPYVNPYLPRTSEATEALGPAVTLYYSSSLLYNNGLQGKSWRGYTAYPVQNTSIYADNIAQAASSYITPHYVALRELAIPARSRRAADAMTFIQWIYDNPCNADTVIYGQEGEDYSLQNQRVVLPQEDATQNGQSMPAWQRWPGRYLFQLAAEQRILADAPDNAEDLLGDRPAKPLAALWLVHLYDTTAWERLTSMDSANSRQNAMQSLWELLLNPSSGSKVSIDPYIKLLRAGADDGILQPYLDVLAEARAVATQPE